MSSEIERISSHFLALPEPCPPSPDACEGILEVVQVARADELPYLFELTAGQRISVSVNASARIDLVLCDEAAYDEWMDSGLQTPHPPSPMLALRAAELHVFEYTQPRNGALLVVLINVADAPVDVVVSARISG